MSAAHAIAAKAHMPAQAAPPAVQAIAPRALAAMAPMASLTAIPSGPSVQRKCAACEEEQSAVQPRLEVGPVGDRYEQEADSIAAQVMAMRDSEPSAASDAAPAVQRACAACSASSDDETRARRMGSEDRASEEDELKVRARREGGPETIAASDSELTSGGAALPASTRSFFETRMGRDLGDVRVHQGGPSAAMNASISARAFTYKNHVWLGAGETAGPSFTMAHELAHVMQQTAPGPVGPQARREASEAEPAVQRKPKLAPFFMPGDRWDSMTLHTQRHEIAQNVIAGANPSIATEVPIPGANADKKETGVCGFADLYSAALSPGASGPMVPGIELIGGDVPSPKDPAVNIPAIGTFTKAAKSSAGCLKSPLWGKAQFKGAKLDTDASAAPRYDKGEVVDIDKAPKGIKLGEIKPAHNVEYRGNGAKQLKNYIDSIEEIRKVTNQHAYKPGGLSKQWHGTPTPMKSLSFPKAWDDQGNPATGWPVKDLKIREPSSKRFIDLSGALSPKTKLNPNPRKFEPTGISGRWMLAEDSVRVKKGDGVFVYYLAPNPADISKALKGYETSKDFSKVAKQVQAVYAALKTPPKVPKVRKMPRTAAPPVARPRFPAIQREAKDNFERARWDAMRVGDSAYADETKTNLKDMLVQYAPEALREKIEGYGMIADWVRTMPDKSQGINYGTAAGAAKEPAQDFQTLRRAIFWSSKWAAPFGLLREKFGWLFVKGFEKFEAAKAAIHKRFATKGQGDYLGKNKGTIRKAAAAVAAIVIPKVLAPFMRTMFNTIIECAEEGFKAKFHSMIEGTGIDDLIQMGEELEEKVKTISDDVEKYFSSLVDNSLAEIKKRIDSFVGNVALLTKIAGGIAEIVKGMRIASCVAGLISSPETVGIGAAIGCGAALGDWILSKFGLSPLEYIVAATIKSCQSQNVIGKIVAELSFMQELPKLAGAKIVNTTKSLLRENLTEVVMEKPLGQHAAEMFCNIDDKQFPATTFTEFRCGASAAGNDETSDRIPRSKTGKYDIPESETPAYKAGDPVTEAERAWMGTDDPPGRDKAPPPTRGNIKGEPVAAEGSAGATPAPGGGGTPGTGKASDVTYRDSNESAPKNVTTSSFEAYFYTSDDVANIKDGQIVRGRVAYVNSNSTYVSSVREFLAFKHANSELLYLESQVDFATYRYEVRNGKPTQVGVIYSQAGVREVVSVNPRAPQ